MGEVVVAALLCSLLNGGVTEQRHHFPNLGETRHVRVDCETPTHVIEVAMDGGSSARDSVHQAKFFEYLTGKRPMVIVIDRDGVEDRWEFETRIVAGEFGIAFGRCKAHFLESWSAAAPFRRAHGGSDLPPLDVALRHCDLGGEFGDPAPVPVPTFDLGGDPVRSGVFTSARISPRPAD